LRLSIIVLIIILIVGTTIITIGYFTNQEKSVIVETTPYEKLEKYKVELEKINTYNQQVLNDLEKKIEDSQISDSAQLNKEIIVLKQVINDNKAELAQIMKKLVTMNSKP
jgi:hypothetical protein